MKLIIAGSRTIYLDSSDLRQLINKFGLKPTEIISGCARGMDKSGEKFAHDMGLHVSEFPADWNLHGKAAGHMRNEQMAKYGDVLLLVWDGQSKGSAGMKSLMKKLNKPIYEEIRSPNEPDYVSRDNYFQFGKYKGQKVSDVPADYLIWCLSNLDFKSLGFKRCVEEELKVRTNSVPTVKKNGDFDLADFGPEPSFDPDDDIPF